jgi:hypothetical protein
VKFESIDHDQEHDCESENHQAHGGTPKEVEPRGTGDLILDQNGQFIYN